MRILFSFRMIALGFFALMGVSIISAFAAGINLPATNVGQESVPVTAEDIKPAACGALFLTNIVSGTGTLTGTAGNDLIIGSAGSDLIDGLSGNDCILGGGGLDTITGNEGEDICLGGPEIDIFIACEIEAQ